MSSMTDGKLATEILGNLPPKSGPSITVSHMARKLDAPRGYIYRRLEALREAGVVDRRYYIGAFAYYRTDEESDQ